MTLQLTGTSICKLGGPWMCLASFVNMLSMGVCTTRHWQESGRLVQEMKVCTVYLSWCAKITLRGQKRMSNVWKCPTSRGG